MRSRFQPEKRQYLLEGTTNRNGAWIHESQLEKCRVRLKAIRHVPRMLLITSEIIALQRHTLHIDTLDGTSGSRPSDVLRNALLLPFILARLYAALRKVLRLIRRNLVVRNENAPPIPTILRIQQIHRMKSRPRPREEIENQRIRLIGNKETNRVMNGIK